VSSAKHNTAFKSRGTVYFFVLDAYEQHLMCYTSQYHSKFRG